MLGDIILVEEHHRQAARVIAAHIVQRGPSCSWPVVVGISGESGSGKSELALALQEALMPLGLPSIILQQDDYYVLPPKSNDRRRRQDLSWVGPQEVQLDRMDRDIRTILGGAPTLEKPLVSYREDRIDTETVSVSGCRTVIAEGTYVALLHTLDERVFIARTYRDTVAARRRRGREAPDPFLEQVLALEHGIVQAHQRYASFVVDEAFHVQRNEPEERIPSCRSIS